METASSSGEEDIVAPGRARRLQHDSAERRGAGQTGNRHETEQLSASASQDKRREASQHGGMTPDDDDDTPTRSGISPRQRAKPRTMARRSGGRTLSLRTESNRASTHTEAATTAARPDSSSPRASRPGRPSGPLKANRMGHRGTSRHSNTSSSSDDEHFRLSTKARSFIPNSPHHAQFPSFRGCARLNGFNKTSEQQQFFDCKFYPYTEPGVDPVFAFVGGSEIGIARPSLNPEESIQVINWLHEDETPPLQSSDNDDDDEPIRGPARRGGKRGGKHFQKPDPIDLNSCAWMQDPTTNTPLLAVSGKPSAIKILDILSNKLVRTLIGHGREVNDLAVSPLDPTILASASGDHTVRIWTLQPEYNHQPCMLMCAGEGHKQALLTLAFHQKGRYLLTGGVDNAICLWVLPSLPNALSGTDKPTMLHFPHFRSASIHTSFVDCVAFHNDLIISKCARENKIVIWRIEGFDSRREPPTIPPTTAEDHSTRSAWGGRFQRLTQLEVNDTSAFYIRFSLFSFPNERPILAIGNERSRVFFWDLKSLEEWTRSASNEDSQSGGNTGRGGRGGRFRKRGRARIVPSLRDSSVASDGSNTRSDSVHPGVMGSGAVMTRNKCQMDDPFKVLEPHRVMTVHKVNFACRQVAWSVGGEWMVVVGDQGMIGIFKRERPE